MFTTSEWKKLAALMKASYKEGNAGLDEILLGALIQAEGDAELILCYRLIEKHGKQNLVDYDHPCFDRLVQLGIIDADTDCPDCAGTGIGHGDPDTSRCHTCGGSGVHRYRTTETETEIEPDYDRDPGADDYFDRAHDYIA